MLLPPRKSINNGSVHPLVMNDKKVAVHVILREETLEDAEGISKRLGVNLNDQIASLIEDWVEKRRPVLDQKQMTITEWIKKPL
jgi:DNA repair exonuclease SbcCD nuclease subunit